jgi:hypothetical protein
MPSQIRADHCHPPSPDITISSLESRPALAKSIESFTGIDALILWPTASLRGTPQSRRRLTLCNQRQAYPWVYRRLQDLPGGAKGYSPPLYQTPDIPAVTNSG